MKKITFIASVGAGLEYYDFVIYALLTSYLSKNFFPQTEPSLALLQTFGIFAAGYFARTLGGLIFGLIGDRYGRKQSFLLAILLMALATFAIGILPTYQQLGSTASFGLLILRIVQGIAFGAELPGAITFITEHAQHKHRGLHSGFMVGSLGLGAAAGSLLILFLNELLTHSQMQDFGWRIPFLLGSTLGIVGFWLRRYAPETPYFLHYRQSHPKPRVSLAFLIKTYPKQLLQGLGIMLFTACFIVFGLSLPAYLHEYYGYSLQEIYRANTMGLLWSACLLPICGLISDKIGRKRQLLTLSLLFALANFLLFKLLDLQHFWALLGFNLVYQTIIAGTAACYIPLLAELFPTSVRYTGIGVAYNLGGALSGLTPLLISSIMHYTSQTLFVSLFFSLLASLTVFAAASLSSKTDLQ